MSEIYNAPGSPRFRLLEISFTPNDAQRGGTTAGNACTSPALAMMPRYFFDILESDLSTPDEVGEELPDWDAARLQAIRCLGEVIRDFPPRHSEGQVEIAVREGAKLIGRAMARISIEKSRLQ